MAEGATLLYLEPDDEITSVVRRLREADAGRVVLVASGRSKATTSAVALRLLAGVAAEEGREVALVADPAGRALAAEAGIPAYASVADASAEDAVPAAPTPSRRAPIRVVRGDEARVLAAAPPPPVSTRPASGPGDETMAVPTPAPRPTPAERRGRPVVAPGAPRRRRAPRVAVVVLLALLLLAAGGAAAVVPAASVVIVPNRVPIEPVTYVIPLPAAEVEEGELRAEADGTATGVFRDPTPATGEATFSNWNTVPVQVSAGTRVAAGEVVFETVETVVVPTGFFLIPGEASVGVQALEAGPEGNVPADAIDTVVSDDVRNALRAFSDNPNRLVRNQEATSGGADNEEPQITRQDMNRARRAVRADLESQLAELMGEDPGLVYGPVEGADAQVPIPDDLVGRRGEASFTLAGSLAYRRVNVRLADVEAAAAERLLGDSEAAPAGRQVAADSIDVEVLQVVGDRDALEVRVRVAADADPMIDEEAIRDLVAGRSEPEAEEALAGLGEVDVALWPDWVDRVPQLAWRIDLQVEAVPAPSGGASASGSQLP